MNTQILKFVARIIDKYLFNKVISLKLKFEDTGAYLKQAVTSKEI